MQHLGCKWVMGMCGHLQIGTSIYTVPTADTVVTDEVNCHNCPLACEEDGDVKKLVISLEYPFPMCIFLTG